MKEMFKKISKYFGGKYMKYWYIAFAISVVLLAGYSFSKSKVDTFKLTVYNEDGSIASEEIVSKDEVESKARSANSRSVEPNKMF